MAQCIEKGCVYSALIGEKKCRQHLGRNAPQLESAVRTEEKEFEVVLMSAVPKFKIMNERSFNIAKAICALAEGHALKAKVNGKAPAFAASVVNYCAKLGIRVKHRKAPGFVYFWKEEAKK